MISQGPFGSIVTTSLTVMPFQGRPLLATVFVPAEQSRAVCNQFWDVDVSSGECIVVKRDERRRIGQSDIFNTLTACLARPLIGRRSLLVRAYTANTTGIARRKIRAAAQ